MEITETLGDNLSSTLHMMTDIAEFNWLMIANAKEDDKQSLELGLSELIGRLLNYSSCKAIIDR